jgi:hypothetical protein
MSVHICFYYTVAFICREKYDEGQLLEAVAGTVAALTEGQGGNSQHQQQQQQLAPFPGLAEVSRRYACIIQQCCSIYMLQQQMVCCDTAMHDAQSWCNKLVMGCSQVKRVHRNATSCIVWLHCVCCLGQ